MTQIPWFVRFLDPLARRLLRWGIPIGPNRLLTVRGRKTGEPRAAGVAVIEFDGRRWVMGTYGVVNWVRNLRAAGEGTLRVGRQPERVRAVELSTKEAAKFFREVLVPYSHGLPLLARMWVPREILDDAESAANSRPVFELHAQHA